MPNQAPLPSCASAQKSIYVCPGGNRFDDSFVHHDERQAGSIVIDKAHFERHFDDPMCLADGGLEVVVVEQAGA